MNPIWNIVTAEEVNWAFEGKDYGKDRNSLLIIREGLLKIACDYANGKATNNVLFLLDLIDEENELTEKGKNYLFTAFKG